MKTNFVYEQVEDILKPKSRENIIKDFENLSVEQKEDIILHSYYRDDLLNYLEDEILSEEESDKIWDNIIDFYIENVNDENLYDEGGNLNEISKEYVKNNMSEIFLNELFVEFLTEKQLNKVIKQLWPEYLKENISDILKPKSKEEIQKIIEERTLKLKELYNKFLKDGFEVDLDLKENTLFVTNKRGWSTWFFLNPNGTFQANVMGYKGDISLGNFNDDYKELKSVVNMINKTWMKDADPFGYQW